MAITFSEAELRKAFLKHAKRQYKLGAEKYMKYQFVVLGVPTPERHKVVTAFTKDLVNLKATEVKRIFKSIKSTEREFLFFKIGVLERNLELFKGNKNTSLIKELLIEASWWDAVDTIAGKVIHPLLFELNAKERAALLKKFGKDSNIWVRRSALVAMVRTNDLLPKTLITDLLKYNLGTEEFFINKAIGWYLRETYFFDRKLVLDFCKKHKLDSVAQREVDRAIAGRSQSGKIMKRALK
jgi:3-methyladenine DNA glycosylase AlkD